MKDLIEKILVYLPQYLSNFGLIFSGPKTFIAAKNVESDTAFTEALLFLGISLALVVLMLAPLQPAGRDFWSSFSSTLVVWLIAVPLAALVIRAAWWIVGGRAPAQSFFVTYAYFFGVPVVLSAAVQLLSMGFFKTFEPELYSQVVAAMEKKSAMPAPSQSHVPLISLAILGIGFLLIAIWGFIAWGAYRKLNGLGRLRSFAAILIAGILTWPVLAIIFMIGAAVRP
jgi:hypothetical protein